MTHEDMTRYRQRLVGLARRLRDEVRDLWEDTPDAEGRTADALSDAGDISSHEYEGQVMHGLSGNEETLLEEVTAALDRIERGTFGRCVTCGQPIGQERLRAVPYARLCIDCAHREEASR